MQHLETWTDIYGSACAHFVGRAGGYQWLVAAPPELAAAVPAQLAALDAKGHVELLVHDNLTALLHLLSGNQWPKTQWQGVVVVAPVTLVAGPAVQLPVQSRLTADGLSFQEGGVFPAWQGHPLPALAGAGFSDNAAASAVASLGFPVVVVAPGTVCAVLEQWMSQTPHGR